MKAVNILVVNINCNKGGTLENIYLNKLHLEPPKGLLNDPNGLSYFRGKYYVFHQWNRFGLNHSYKEWGLFTSTDLLEWKHEGSALLPDTIEDKDGIYSGSAMVYKDQLYLFYTGNTKNNGIRKSFQKVAISKDGIRFLKNPGFTTPSGLSEHHRDPKVFRYQDLWWMIVGSQMTSKKGVIALYQSKNLMDWTYEGVFFADERLDQMCECPDLLDFQSKQVLICSPQKRDIVTDSAISSYSAYILGFVKAKKFEPISNFMLLDYGFDFYAPQTFKDPKGRYIMLAWMSRMTDEEEEKCPTKHFGYLHCLTMPRELILKDDQLIQRPLEEILNTQKLLKIDSNSKFSMMQNSEILSIEINFKEDVNHLSVILADEVELIVDTSYLTLKRKSWVDDSVQEKGLELTSLKKLEIFLDMSAIEIFINDGQKVMSLRYFPKTISKKHIINCQSKHLTKVSSLNIGGKNGK